MDYSSWNWTQIIENKDVKIDDKYKVVDYIYSTEYNKFVKGIVVSEGFQTNYTAYEIAYSYPKLYEIIKDMAHDVTECYFKQKNCQGDIYSYNYPMKYMQELVDLKHSIEWHYVVTSALEYYYDSDNDGYVDTSSKNGYLIAPIDEYNNRFGELIN